MNTLKLITLDDLDTLNSEVVEKIYRERINAGQSHYFKILGLHKTLIKRAQGVYYYNQDNIKILDFVGGFGCTAIGHNHPRLLRAKQKFQDEMRHDVAQWFYSQYVAALSENLGVLAPGDLECVLLYNTGSEAIEAGLKIIEMYQGSQKSKLIYAQNSFHGRTRGALSITDSAVLRSTFKLFHEHIKVPFGDVEIIERILQSDQEVGGIVLEPIQGGAGVILPSEGYLKKISALCREYDVLLFLDEIQCGLGRSGKLFAFEYENILPDLVAVAKPLSGAKTAISALVVRKPVYQKVMTNPKEWYINAASTFGGMGEACVIALETLNIIVEDGLIENVKTLGEYFLTQLESLQQKHSKFIREVRGRGFIIAIEFQDVSQALGGFFKRILSPWDDKLKGGLTGLIATVIFHQYQIVVGFTGTNPNVIRLHPPYITQKEHIDYFIQSLDEILGLGLYGIVKNFIKIKL